MRRQRAWKQRIICVKAEILEELRLQFGVKNLWCDSHSLIHSGYFYSASSDPLLLRGALVYIPLGSLTIDQVSLQVCSLSFYFNVLTSGFCNNLKIDFNYQMHVDVVNIKKSRSNYPFLEFTGEKFPSHPTRFC